MQIHKGDTILCDCHAITIMASKRGEHQSVVLADLGGSTYRVRLSRDELRAALDFLDSANRSWIDRAATRGSRYFLRIKNDRVAL